MVDINQIINEISRSTNIDKQIVDTTCKHVFQCLVELMKDPEDTHDILFNGLFKFKLKPRFRLNKTKNYSPNEDK